MSKILVSIIIPVRNEKEYIDKCLNSVYQFDLNKDEYEVIIVDGNSDDGTEELISKYPYVKLISNSLKIVPISMNLGIAVARGKYIVRLDAHCEYPTNYISKLICAAADLKADNVGGICITSVLNNTPSSQAIKIALSHPLGVGNSLFRTGIKDVAEVDTVPFGCFRKEVFTKYGLYNERLVRNQDIELNKRIKRGGGKIYLIPDVICTYYARDNYIDFIKSNYGNGLWNILTVFITGTVDSLSYRHFIPLAFLLSLLLPLIIGTIYPWFILVSIFSIMAYWVLLIPVSIASIKGKNISLFNMIGAFVLLHIPYGWGSLVGIFKVIGKSVFGKQL